MSYVLITGINKGLGLDLTKLYLQKGDIVFGGSRRETSDSIAQLKETYKENFYPFVIDIGDTSSVEKAFAEVSRHTKTLDIIINNAAIHLKDSRKPLEEASFDDMLKTYDVNTLGALRVTKAFLPLLKKGEDKALVNISSEAGSISDCRRTTEFDYCMSKSALNMGSAILQNYLKPEGIKVLAIHPGWMRTPMGGPNADIEADTAAQGIIALIQKHKKALDGPMYMDYTGKLMNW